MRNYSDPTANAAIGSVEKEFKSKQKLAKRLKELRLQGRLSEEQLEDARKYFRGIFTYVYDEIFEE